MQTYSRSRIYSKRRNRQRRKHSNNPDSKKDLFTKLEILQYFTANRKRKVDGIISRYNLKNKKTSLYFRKTKSQFRR